MSSFQGIAWWLGPDPGGSVPAWTPASATGGGVSVHTWIHAGAGLFQDVAKTTPATADGNPVGAAVSQGSDTATVSQGTAGARPTLKLNIVNGKPVLRFDGGDYLQGALVGALSQPFNVFAVVKLNSGKENDNGTYYFLDGDDATNRLVHGKADAAPDTWRLAAGFNRSGGISDANWNIWTSQVSGATGKLWINGMNVISGDVGSNNADGLTVGSGYTGGFQWPGDLAEILIYDPSLATADLNQVGQYLATKYGLSWTAIV